MLASIHNLHLGKSVGRLLSAALGTFLFISSTLVYADGSETLGPPGISIASGSDIIANGIGLAQAQPGTIDLTVPSGATVQQVLLYWQGFGANQQNDDTIVIDGITVTGALIGGPDLYFEEGGPGNPDSTWYSSTFRADITGLGLIGPGANSVTVGGLDFNRVNNGAGVIAIIDDGSTAQLEIRDGDDIAWIGWPEPRMTTVAQTFTFPAASVDRVATISMFFASVRGDASGTGNEDRPSVIEVVVDGTVTEFNNQLGSTSGPEWDTLIRDVNIPAGASQMTIQALSEDRLGTDGLPASMVWTATGVKIPPAFASLGDRVWLDTDGDGIQNCTEGSTPPDDILGNAGDTGSECGNGVVNVMVNLLEPGDDGACGTTDDAPLDSTMTDANGFYGFGGLDAGDYCVAWKKPDGFECTLANVGGNTAVSNISDSDGVDIGGGICASNEVITLDPGENDLTWDLGLVPPPPTVSLGDRVWKDVNGDGTQNCSEGSTPPDNILGNAGDTGPECGEGIDGIPVMLLMGSCETGGVVMQDTTSNGGFYLFEGLTPGADYCVMFGKPDNPAFCRDPLTGIDLGDPLFTLQNEGNDGADSDADPVTGKAAVTNLLTTDLTVDAGIVCPVKIGDRVWEDDGNGVQDTDENNANIEDVTARLYSCGENMIFENGGGDDIAVAEQATDANGMYMFGGRVPGPTLDPGKYYVIFDSASYPDGYSATLPGQGPEAVDSECMPEACIDLTASGAVNLAQDCGLVPPPPPECKLTLDKSCLVATPPPQDFDKCDGKLQQFTLVWNGGASISGISLVDNNGTSVSTTSVDPGQSLTVFGPFDNNDVEITFNGGVNGQSVFHTSCSDDDFNSPDDCGKPAGNGKGDDSGFDDLWSLSGFVDNEGRVLVCNGGSDGEFAQECSFEKPPAPSCETTGKPETLTWRYDGGSGSCADSTFNVQKDFTCSGSVDTDAQIVVIDDVGGSHLVNPGDEFTVVKDDNQLELELSNNGGTQDVGLHVSCSQPLEVGFTAGALTLVGLDGLTGGADVTYRYLVTNDGDPLSDVTVSDNLLGPIGGPVALGTGGSAMFDKTVPLFETTTNIGTASGTMLTSGGVCEPPALASDSLTVTVTEPTCQVSIVLDKIEDKKIKWKLSNSSNIDATIDDLTISWPGTQKLKKVKFDGNDILKDVALSSPAEISNWLKEVKDRTLKAGDSGKKLEFEFTGNFPEKDDQPASDFDLTVNFEEGCSVDF